MDWLGALALAEVLASEKLDEGLMLRRAMMPGVYEEEVFGSKGGGLLSAARRSSVRRLGRVGAVLHSIDRT